MIKNTAGQKVIVYAHDTAADAPKTGDAANITAYIAQDAASIGVSNDANPTELDATNMKGLYAFDLTQAETNGDTVTLSAVSATGDVSIEPVTVYTQEVMRGTDSASTHSAANVVTAMEADGTKLDHLWETTEDDGGTRRFTENALEEAPGGPSGSGAISFVYTLTSSVTPFAPIAGATIWATSDEAGTNVVASGTSDTAGQVTFLLDAGTYYIWRQLSGWTFTNPDTEVVA